MSLFGNQNFMNQIAREMGCQNLSEEVSAMMQTLVQIETRKFIQKAGKFMCSDRRDQINFEDANAALNQLGHSDLALLNQQQEYIREGSSYIRRDPIYRSAKDLIEEELKSLSINFSAPPKLRCRWIYIDGKIPRTNDNKALKCKTQIIQIRQKQIGEKNKKFNIIMDQPESMLTAFELDYYRDVTALLSEGNENIGKLTEIDITGNVSNLFPLFLKYFLSSEMTDIKMTYFLALLENKYIEISVEYHLHQILTYLWAYEGDLSFKVGELLGRYIKRYGSKYQFLFTMWVKSPEKDHLLNQESRNTAYNNLIKRIAIELITGISIQIPQELLKAMQEDSNKGVRSAMLCEQKVIEYSFQIECLRESDQKINYWIPDGGDYLDQGYLMMTL